MNSNQELVERATAANFAIAEMRGEQILEMEATLEIPIEDIRLFLSQPQGSRMLDVGCCTGRYAARFLLSGLEYVGIDHSPTRIRLAKERHRGTRFDVMDYRNLTFADGSFDRIWSCCVFHYEPKCNMLSILRDMKRLLSSNGMMLVVLPWSPVSEEGFLSDTGSYMSCYTPKEFKQYLEEAGFQCQAPVLRHNSFSMTFIATK
jgi:ubiquinone/menaquinone biosynthesis C-methylase UbiE